MATPPIALTGNAQNLGTTRVTADHVVETGTNKVLTAAERTAIAANTAAASAAQSDATQALADAATAQAAADAAQTDATQAISDAAAAEAASEPKLATRSVTSGNTTLGPTDRYVRIEGGAGSTLSIPDTTSGWTIPWVITVVNVTGGNVTESVGGTETLTRLNGLTSTFATGTSRSFVLHAANLWDAH